MDNMAVFVNHNVAVVTILDLEQKAQHTIRSH